MRCDVMVVDGGWGFNLMTCGGTVYTHYLLLSIRYNTVLHMHTLRSLRPWGDPFCARWSSRTYSTHLSIPLYFDVIIAQNRKGDFMGTDGYRYPIQILFK